MATVGAPRHFCRCACFCTDNLYVARYGLHVRFRGEQQLRRDYGPLEQEVERRQRLGQESAARKALIASSYHPARPEVYDSLQDAALAPEFLAVTEYSVSPDADLKGLLQRLETVSGEVLALRPGRTREWQPGKPGCGMLGSLQPPSLPPKTKPAGAGRVSGTNLPGAGHPHSFIQYLP
uniref:cDNA FLJ59129 n=1 Tax=Homo sapiens TaxID=9606 RepID=B4DZU3_HUMAN|nr:unnamed protein product [Homo sapiens]